MTVAPASPAASQQAAVDAALLILERMGLSPDDLDREQCLVLLREKGETVRWQPVSPTLMAALARRAAERHAPPDGRLLRYTDGRRPPWPPTPHRALSQ